MNFQESMTILNAYTKKGWNLIESTTYIYIYIYIYSKQAHTLYLYVNVSKWVDMFVCEWMYVYVRMSWLKLKLEFITINKTYNTITISYPSQIYRNKIKKLQVI